MKKQRTIEKRILCIFPILALCIMTVFLSSCQDTIIPSETDMFEETHTPALQESDSEPVTEESGDMYLYNGPDGEEYMGEFYGGLFGLDSRLTNLVSYEEYLRYTEEIFAHSFDFSIRSFCRYFSISEEEYRETLAPFSNYEIYGEVGKYKTEKYPLGVYGSFEDFIEVFVREEYRLDYRTEEWMPKDGCVHTYTYHTISDEMIAYVGEDEYRIFRQKYAGTEEFNILNFLSYFYIEEEDAKKILTQSADVLPIYNVDYLFGDETMQREYFIIKEYQSDEQTKLYYGLPTKAEFQSITGWYVYDAGMHQMICAFLRSDWETFAQKCGVDAKVYAYMENMKIGEYALTGEKIPASDDPTAVNTFPVLSFMVLESDNEVFPVGEHQLVWVAGMNVTFEPRETFRYTVSSPGEMSKAARYLMDVGSDRDFSPVLSENKRQFGLCDFIVGRLNVLYDNDEPRSEKEIGDYAEKYLGVDRTALEYEKTLNKTESGYTRIERGGGQFIRTVLSEEIRDGITVVTVQFWADASKTVPSRKVEFYLEWLEGEYKPLYSVILEDSDFHTAFLST